MKHQLENIWFYLRDRVGVPMLVLIALFGSYFLYAFVRDWQLNRGIEIQNAKIEKFNQQADAAIKSANSHLQIFEIERQNTKYLVDAVQEMSVSVKKLADNDRVIELRVNNLGKDYEQTRNQKRSDPIRVNRSAIQREADVLRADKELYPN